MQKELKGTPKSSRRRINDPNVSEIGGRILSDVTSNVPRSGTSRNRTTMMPGDITLTMNQVKKKIAVNSRQSTMPLHLSKNVDTESKDIEFGLLYDEYLQAMMMDLIIKKRTEEKKHLMVTQLATIVQQIDQDTKKLIKLKIRVRDIINLSLAQKEVDAQLAAVKECTKHETFKSVEDLLSKLQSFLQPMDVLRCNGIILPKTQEEWERTREILTKCSNTLKSIINLIGSKGETYCAVNDGLKNFVETLNEIEDLEKKLKETLCNLQAMILKNASLSLMHTENK
ncbi:uncharacterized protein LOC114929360 [Nylanderia fulva]|uniref:uncharacterized protein LOC114929360 n=1 Tax=Nylanderia fulva TaxID=613905 RepID=UPI0010FB53C2|nr:uncharacterized protein LOC114929360 [Nylanderia fulva]